MNLFFKTPKKQPDQYHYFSVLDIGTDVVKVLVCQEDKGKGNIVGVGKQKQRLGDMHNGTIIDIEGVTENCREALKEAETMANVHPTDIIIGIAGELVKGLSTGIEYVRKDSFEEISMAELQNIVHKVQWKAFDEIREQIKKETGFNELDVKLIHSAIANVNVDGYKISNPLGFKGTNVKVTVFNVFAPLVHFEALTAIAAALDKDLLSIASEPYAVSKCLGFEDGSDFSAIFVDIGGGTTDVAVVLNGGVMATRMFGIGGRVFTKRLAKHFNVPFQEAEQRKIEFSHDKLAKRETSSIEKLFASDLSIWSEALALTLQDIPHIDVLPSKILLCGGGALLPSIKEILEETPWFDGVHFAKPPKISYLHPKDIINILDQTNLIKNIQDVTPMALANLALELTGNENLVTKMLKKAIRIVER
jgi:cell division protein FtsA